MAVMNRGTKKLIALLEREVANLNTEFAKSLVASAFKSVENYFNSKNNIVDPKNIDYIKDVISNHADKFVDDVEDDIYLKIEMSQVLKALQKGMLFLLFDCLDDVFEHFDFPVKHQLDVLGYIIKNNSELYKEAEISINEDEKKLKNGEDYSKIFEPDLKMFKANLLDEICEDIKELLNSPEFSKGKNEVFKNYELVANHIDGNCRFKPTTDLFELHYAIIHANIGLTAKQEKIIIWDVSEKQLRKYDAEFNEQYEKERMKQSGRVYTSDVDLNKKNKEQNVAEHELKKYLVDDYPICFIDELTLEEIKRLMSFAGYREERINKVIKNIEKNNEVLYEKDSIHKFVAAKTKYLTIEEQEILSCAEQILNCKESLINPSYKMIKENYEIVKEDIMSITSSEDESLELIRYAIEEIRNAVIEYSYSDYRLRRELK